MKIKYILIPLLLIGLAGCSTINVPNYIRDEHPYKKLYYTEFDHVREAVKESLEHRGWRVIRETDPGLFEVQRDTGSGEEQQVLMYTDIRASSFFVGTKYSRINAFLRVMPDGGTEVELRYFAVTTVAVKNFDQYRNDYVIDQIFEQIDNHLN